MKIASTSLCSFLISLSASIHSIHASPSLQHPIDRDTFDTTEAPLCQAGLLSVSARVHCRGHCRVPLNLPKMCCSCWNPCICGEDDICPIAGNFLSILAPGSAPGSDPETVFFDSMRDGPGAPCCGPNCRPQQCLDMTKLELGALEGPLKWQLETLNESTLGVTADSDPKPTDCCGPGCEVTGCFRTLLNTVIKMQTPINNTQNNFPDRALEMEEGVEL